MYKTTTLPLVLYGRDAAVSSDPLTKGARTPPPLQRTMKWSKCSSRDCCNKIKTVPVTILSQSCEVGTQSAEHRF